METLISDNDEAVLSIASACYTAPSLTSSALVLTICDDCETSSTPVLISIIINCIFSIKPFNATAVLPISLLPKWGNRIVRSQSPSRRLLTAKSIWLMGFVIDVRTTRTSRSAMLTTAITDKIIILILKALMGEKASSASI